MKMLLPLLVLVVMVEMGCEGAGRELGQAVGTTVDNTVGVVLADRATEQEIEHLRQLAYPAAAKLGADLDVLVVHRGNRILLANRTTHQYEGVQLWLNRQYVAEPAPIPVGPGHRLDLRGFVNRYGETYPVGKVLSPDKSFPVVLAELYDPATGLRHRMTVEHPLQ
jgi:hypothetical protein